MERKKIRIGITQGDINGIGYEVIIKAFSDHQILDICTPIIYGSPKAAAFHRKQLSVQSFNLNVISNSSEAHYKKINIINCSSDDLRVDLASPTPEAAAAAIASLEMATKDLKEGNIDALVTCPINRKNIDNKQFSFAGHSEYLEKEVGAEGDSIMLMVDNNLRVANLTGHTPISQLSKTITKELIIDKAEKLASCLITDFGITKPRIAVLGLNPHAGTNGLLGDEETNVIAPAIKELNEKGHIFVGPLSADGLFGSGHYQKYDAILAMYHDQGMIPFKALSMNHGINFTANLPIIRTAPIHGAEYDIAGKNLASDVSFRNAIFLASDIYHSRILHSQITKDPLKKQEVDRGHDRYNNRRES